MIITFHSRVNLARIYFIHIVAYLYHFVPPGLDISYLSGEVRYVQALGTKCPELRITLDISYLSNRYEMSRYDIDMSSILNMNLIFYIFCVKKLFFFSLWFIINWFNKYISVNIKTKFQINKTKKHFLLLSLWF